MKSRVIKLITTLLVIFTLVGCKKDSSDTNAEAVNSRIISEKWYSDNQLSYELSYEYSGNKLSRLSSSSGNLEWLFEYPDKNKITYNYFRSDGPDFSDNGSGIITLVDNKVTEITMDDIGPYGEYKYKATLVYNSDGEIESIKYYDYDGSWIFYSEDTFTYSSGKLVQIMYSYPTEVPISEYRYAFTYNGDELNDQVYSRRESGGDWIERSKKNYTYNLGKITKMISYWKNQTSWVEEWDEEYTYDNNGYLIEKATSKYKERTEYTYEDGSGNYAQIFEFMENDGEIDNNPDLTPVPNKSKVSVRDLMNTHKFTPRHSFINTFSPF